MTVGAADGAGTGVVVPELRWIGTVFRCGSLTTVMDKLFLPGNMYVSLTHTIPSRRLALTLDEVTDVEDMDAEHRQQENKMNQYTFQLKLS